MGKLFDQIRAAITEDRIAITPHANEQLRERRIIYWQVLAGIDQARLISERETDKPFPSVEVEQQLADGTPVHVVWSYTKTLGLARLVTVHFYDW